MTEDRKVGCTCKDCLLLWLKELEKRIEGLENNE